MPRHRNLGFTLVELVVIITIIGILAIVVSARFTGQTSFDARGYYDELTSAARYAQRYAIASGCSVQLEITSNTYSLDMLNSGPGCAAVAVQNPTGGAFAGSAPGGVTAGGDLGDYIFNALGDVDAGGSIQVSGGGSAFSFDITAASGFVVAP